jgi:hypothetical protein
MAASRLCYSALLQLAAIAILLLMDLNGAYAVPPLCPKCKKNKNGKRVCVSPKNFSVICCPKRRKKRDKAADFGPSAAPSVYFEYEPDYDEPTGYMYDLEDKRYEYEDGTVVPGLERTGVDDLIITFPERPRNCRGRDPLCSDDCKKGKCCLSDQRVNCEFSNPYGSA